MQVAMLSRILKTYWQISIFKETPANTPYSAVFMVAIGLIYMFVLLVQWELSDLEQALVFPRSMVLGFAIIASYGIYTYLILFLSKFSNRFVQTQSAIFTTHLYIHLISFPLLGVAPMLTNPESILLKIFALLYLLVVFAIAIWQFMVTAFIYKEALQISFFQGVLASFGLLAFNILVVSFW